MSQLSMQDAMHANHTTELMPTRTLGIGTYLPEHVGLH